MEKDFKNILIRILNNFAEDGMVFTNEQNFQFYLGSALQSEEIVGNVYFEVFSVKREEALPFSKWISKSKDIDKKFDESLREYTDLIIELTNGKFIAIELKYKLADRRTYYRTLNGEFFLTKQGAVVNGAYNFVEDIKRLEDINNRYIYLPGHPNEKMTRCFSILLTNNKRYRCNTFKKYEQFSLKEDNILKGKLSTDDKNHERSIILKGSYELKWHNYELKKFDGTFYDDYLGENKNKAYEPGFSYLIIEVKPKKDEPLRVIKPVA